MYGHTLFYILHFTPDCYFIKLSTDIEVTAIYSQ